MFLCISLNPAVDKRLNLPSLVRGEVNRAQTVQSFPGGKSVHVAMVLQALGGKPTWTGPCGGASGQELLAGLSALGIQAIPCAVQNSTRTNLEILEGNGVVTEILEPGSAPNRDEWKQFESQCKGLFAESAKDVSIIFSGSLPAGAATTLYADLITMARGFGCKTFLDTSGEPLRQALNARPYFVKPNREEAGQLLGKRISGFAGAVDALQQLLTLGAQSAALSLGSEGLLFSPGQDSPVLFAPVVPVQPRSTVGCGDAALAGFAFGIASGYGPEATLQLAAACGGANCVADSPGAARIDKIRDFQQKVQVRELAPDF